MSNPPHEDTVEQVKENPLRKLSDSQDDESSAIADILHRNIRRSGKYAEKLADYSNAFARTEKFNVLQAEGIIRDQFEFKYGQDMYGFLEELRAREKSLPAEARDDALEYARMISPLIRDGDTMPFWQAFERTGGALAEKYNVTEVGAKSLMKEVFWDAEGRDLYEHGKELEALHHAPVRVAKAEARRAHGRQEREAGPTR